MAVFVALGVAVLGSCSDDDGAADRPEVTVPTQWVTVADDTTGLTFALPGDIDQLTQGVQLPDGTATELKVYSHVDGDREVAVSVLPLDPDDFDLESAAIGAAEAVRGELVEVHPIDTLDFRGRELEVAAVRDGRDWTILQRIFLTDDALVQLQVTGPTDERAELVVVHEQLVAGLG